MSFQFRCSWNNFVKAARKLHLSSVWKGHLRRLKKWKHSDGVFISWTARESIVAGWRKIRCKSGCFRSLV